MGCYIQDFCKKFKNNACVNIDGNSSCPMLFGVDTLLTKALLSESQKKPVKLFIDNKDRAKYLELGEIEKNIVKFVKDGKNIYIHSVTCGNGKTAWSIKLLQAYIFNVWVETTNCRALFINVPRFLLALKDSITKPSEYVEAIRENVLNADLVVWDEIGIKALTDYEHEHLLNLINTRIDLGKSNIYTSNLTPEDLKDRIGDRLYSRVVNLSKEIVFYGDDKRGLV